MDRSAYASLSAQEGTHCCCARHRQGRVRQLPDTIGFDGRCYDLIVLLDVLEHVEQDREALAALRDRLAPGGRILLTVPAAPLALVGA